MLEIWTEKYRPRKLDEVVGQESITTRLKAFVKEGSIPNMLFAGPAGCGKTATAIALARELYGDRWRANFGETNASDDRGIDVVRTRIKNFARTKSLGAAFKIVCLDEADALTPEAQQALRRTMETYTSTARFILTCNYSSRIIDPIQSRCAVFRFRPLAKEDATKVLQNVCKKEGLQIEQKSIDAILYLARGDMRRAINLLQSCAAVGKKIIEKTVYEVSAQAHPADIRKMLDLALQGKFIKAREILLSLLIDRGIAGEDIIKEIHRQVFDLDVKEKQRVELIEKIGEYEFRIDQGGDPQIQLEALLAQFLV
jgi:replication factor C small subunit